MPIIAYAFLGSFLFTAFLLQWWEQPAFSVSLFLGLSGILGILIAMKRKQITAALIGVIFAFATVARVSHVPTPNTIETYANGNSVEIRGMIADEPDRRPLQTKYTIDIERLTNESGTVLEGINGKVLVTDYRKWPEYRFGETVLVEGILERPGTIDTFRYDRYLSRFDTYAVMYGARMEPVSIPRTTDPVSLLRGKLYRLKQAFEYRINRIYPEPHASFMAGLLTGSRRGIPKHLTEAFATTGLTHIIAISGYNITIVIMIIGSLLFWLPPNMRFYPSIGAIILFTLFVGASAAVVRAAIMGMLCLLALQLKRIGTVRLIILWTAFLMTAWNPKLLWYDAGFQLSFLAVVGITELSPLISHFFARVPRTLGMRETLTMTFAAQIAVLPVIVILFGKISFIAPLSNLLVAPVIPFAMLFGSTGVLLSFISFPLGQLVAYLGWGCLEWIIRVATLFASIPFASVDVKMPPGTLISYYGILIGILLLRDPVTTHTEAAPSSPGATGPASTSREYGRGI